MKQLPPPQITRVPQKTAEQTWKELGAPAAPAKIKRSRVDGKLYEEHHVVSDKNRFTKKHELWELSGMQPNERANKVYLPTRKGAEASTTKRSIHQGRHRNEVSERLAEKMTRKIEQGKEEGWIQEQYAEALLALIKEEKRALKSGERILNKNQRERAKPFCEEAGS